MSTITPKEFQSIIGKVTENKKGAEQAIYLTFLLQDHDAGEAYKRDMKMKVLKTLLDKDDDFFAYLDRIIVDTAIPEQILQNIEHVFNSAKLTLNRKHRDTGGLTQNAKTGMFEVGTVAIARTMEKLSPEILVEITSNAGKIVAVEPCNFGPMMQACLDKLRIVGPRAGPVLALAYLTYEGGMAIYKWWDREISGQRCVQQILTSVSSVTAAYYGGIGGAALAAFYGLGPYGIVAATLAAGTLAAKVSELLILWGFDMPKEQTEEQAYKYLGVTKSASANEVNTAFYALCRSSHPDKPGGSHERFIQLQVHMNVIRAARGEIGR